ncbi:MAG: 50S ribosomal protein L18 [Promethearchaeota archaeon]
MAHGPRYRVSMRRRREGKTNYHRRLRLVLSGKLRLVIRVTLKNTIVQIAKANIKGDQILANAHSIHLKKYYNWNYNTGNMTSAYLTGYLCGLRAKKAGIQEAILDLGVVIHQNRVKSALKGVLDAGLKIPYSEKFFEKTDLDNRIKGIHIENYAKLLSKNKKEYEKQFSNYIKNNVDPKKISAEFEKTKKLIEKKV